TFGAEAHLARYEKSRISTLLGVIVQFCSGSISDTPYIIHFCE
ncbi:hypothetical protein HMPREF3216_00001, partial [Gardnerella vaginalis]